jgi:hypothetical protein
MRAARIYRSYEDFERDELRNADRLQLTLDEMLDEMFAEELDFDPGVSRKKTKNADNEVDDDE